jgi:hypothetical protein
MFTCLGDPGPSDSPKSPHARAWNVGFLKISGEIVGTGIILGIPRRRQGIDLDSQTRPKTGKMVLQSKQTQSISPDGRYEVFWRWRKSGDWVFDELGVWNPIQQGASPRFLNVWRAIPDCSVNESNVLSESMLGGRRKIGGDRLSIAEASNGACKSNK